MGEWASLETARRDWPDAPSDDDLLTEVLTIGRAKCEAFGPALVDPEIPPAGWSYAQTLAARDVWQAARRDGDLIGFESYAVRVQPLSPSVQAILRPPTGRPDFG